MSPGTVCSSIFTNSIQPPHNEMSLVPTWSQMSSLQKRRWFPAAAPGQLGLFPLHPLPRCRRGADVGHLPSQLDLRKMEPHTQINPKEAYIAFSFVWLFTHVENFSCVCVKCSDLRSSEQTRDGSSTREGQLIIFKYLNNCHTQ